MLDHLLSILKKDHLLNRIRNNKFIRNVFTLTSGTILAQAISLSVSPILTRIYTTEDFGVVALYIAVVSIFGNIITGKYDSAIMIPATNKEAFNILILSMLLTVFFSSVLFLVILFFGDTVLNLSGYENLLPYLYWMPFSIIMIGSYQGLNLWMNRRNYYKILSINKIYQSSATASSNIGFGTFGFQHAGLVYAQIIGQAVGTFSLGWKAYRDMKFKIKFKWYTMFILSKKYIKYPKYILPTALIATVTQHLPTFFVSSFFSVMLLGLYSLTDKMLSVPATLIGSAFSQSFYHEFSQRYNSNDANIKIFLLKVWSVLAIFGFVPFGLIVMHGPEIFSFIFGEPWRQSGEIASILSIYYYARLITSPTINALLVLGYEHLMLKLSIVIFICRFVSLAVGYYYSSFYLSLYLIVISEIIVMIFTSLKIYRKVKE